jgi:hypothetical protein
MQTRVRHFVASSPASNATHLQDHAEELKLLSPPLAAAIVRHMFRRWLPEVTMPVHYTIQYTAVLLHVSAAALVQILNYISLCVLRVFGCAGRSPKRPHFNRFVCLVLSICLCTWPACTRKHHSGLTCVLINTVCTGLNVYTM